MDLNQWIKTACLCGLILFSKAAYAETWVESQGSGLWTDVNNWENLTFPNGIGSQAIISPTPNATITLNAEITLEQFESSTSSTVKLISQNDEKLIFNVNGGNAQVNIEGDGARSIETSSIELATTCFFLQNNTTQPLILGSVLSGAGGISKNGQGDLILSKNNTFEGRTTVSEGRLALVEEGSIANSSELRINGGVFELVDGNATVNNLIGSGGILKVNDNQLVINQSDASYTFEGKVVGTENGVIRKKGNQILFLSGDNAFPGTLIVEEGALLVASTVYQSLSGVGSVVIKSEGTLSVEGAPQSVNQLSGEPGAKLMLSENIFVDQEKAAVFGGIISGSGDFFKNGGGDLVLTANNEGTGETVVSEGRLVLGGVGSIAQSKAVDIKELGTLEIAQGAGGKLIYNLVGSGKIELNDNHLIIDQSSDDASFVGTLSGADGSFEKRGSKLLALGGTNTLTGKVTISEGVLMTLNDNLSLASADSIEIGSQGAFFISGGSQQINTLTGSGQLNLGGNELTINQKKAAVFSGDISGVGSIVKIGREALTLSGNNQVSGMFSIDEGALMIASNHSLLQRVNVNGGSCTLTEPEADLSQADVDISNGLFKIASEAGAKNIQTLSGAGGILELGASLTTTQNKSETFNGEITGPGTLTKQGPEKLILTQPNTLTGLIVIKDGSLILEGDGAVENSTGIQLEKGVFELAPGAGYKTVQNLEVLGGQIQLNDNTLEIIQKKDCDYFGTVIASREILKAGEGTIIFHTQNSMTGKVKIIAGAIEVTPSGSFSSDRLNEAITNVPELEMSGGLFKIQFGSGEKTVGSLMGAGGEIDLNDNTLNVYQTTASTCASVFSTATGTLQKLGPEPLTLSGLSADFQGSIEVAQGQLTMNGDFSQSKMITVADQATLRGLGQVGNVQIASGGTLSPGAALGTLTSSGHVHLASEATYQVEISENTSNQLQASGEVTIDSKAILHVYPEGTLIAGTTYNVIESDTNITGIGQIISESGVSFSSRIIPKNPGALLSDPLHDTGGSILQLTALNTLIFPQKSVDSKNSAAVVSYLNCLNIQQGSNFVPIILLLDTLNNKEFNAAMNQLTPVLFGSFTYVNLDNNALITALCTDPYTRLQCNMGQDFSTRREKNSVWTSLFGNFTRLGKDSRFSAYDTQGGGLMGGYDRLIGKNGQFGLGVGYLYTALDWEQSLGKADIHKIFGAVYSSYTSYRFTLDLAALGGGNLYRVNRNISFATLRRRASTHYTGFFLTPHIGLNINLYKNRAAIHLLGELDYFYLYQPEHTESGAGQLNLKVKQKDSHALRTRLGLRISHQIQLARGCLRLFATPSWVTKIPFGAGKFQAQFKEFSYRKCQLVVDTFDTTKFLFAIDSGILYALEKFSFSIMYRGELGNCRYLVHQAEGKTRWAF
ncbi:MAG: autotransporter-associated beta strand repeat-containing protein [Chlamydiota bacterium]